MTNNKQKDAQKDVQDIGVQSEIKVTVVGGVAVPRPKPTK